MRKMLALVLMLLLLPLPLAGAENTTEDTAPAAPQTKEEWEEYIETWHNKTVSWKRMPEHIEIVPWEELSPVREGQHHYLLLCIDQWVRDPRPADAKPPRQRKSGMRRDMYGNTDGIVILTLDTRAHRIMLTSIIRDAIIQKPDSTEDKEIFGRINYVYNDSGPEALCKVISQHLGVPIEKYIIFTFKQIANIVDYMGGVELELNSEEIKALKLTTLKGTVTDPEGRDIQDGGYHPEGIYTFRTTAEAEAANKKTEEKNQGTNKVVKRTGGCSAVLYMRIRKFGGGGDFMRTQRARNVLSALADKCREMSFDDAKALANNVAENNNLTNMTLQEMYEAAQYAFSLKDCTIEELRIPGDKAARAINHAEMDAQEINWSYCRMAFLDYLENTVLTVDESSYLVQDDPDDADW